MTEAQIVALLDASVLYPALLRDILLRLAFTGGYAPRWSALIQTEWTNALRRDRPDIPWARIERTRTGMHIAFPSALVTGFEALIPTVSLPDLDDRHVVAAAREAGAQVIVTANLRDFPATALEAIGLRAEHPDSFLTRLFETDPTAVLRGLRQMRAAMLRTPRTQDELVFSMRRLNLKTFADAISAHAEEW